ncbi:A disintegrin and metalloproteinase with thrombospondin motifs adt-1 [Wyeomyia smithii]|uniref:A disintegrin and metalloproteinase with thrombospondin motifs adt-1 n=1 Tax=Wyeomyia smithii TaxID=174621 RepID=UPI002467B866|nr:A disintegrin and metalloproteinase with thrombospondin motifs adt-1 [Wyeomyia smithii]
MFCIAASLVTMFLLQYARKDVVGYQLDVRRVDRIVLDNSEIDEGNLHKFLKEHERVLIFGTNVIDNFNIVTVKKKRRTIRSSDRFINFNLSNSSDESISLRLEKSNILIDEAFAFLESYGNLTQLMNDSYNVVQKYANCFYRNDHAAFDLCDGEVRGVVRSVHSELIIHPLPKRFGSNKYVVINKTPTYTRINQTDKSIKFEPDMSFYEPQRLFFDKFKRSKRQLNTAKIPNVLYIETAIFIDKDLYRHMFKNFPKNTEANLIRFVLAMINGVQLIYNHPSLGHPINFILKRLEVLHNEPKDLQRSSDIDIYLNSFCGWQQKLNPVSDDDPVHFDHAVILTGLDLYVLSKTGKASNQVVGLAPVAGMCTRTSSCTINEGKHFESVFVVSHEIGHNLGMRHDSSENNCDPSLYIMSPTLGSGKTTWSACSRNYLNSFLKTSQALCLFDRGQFGQYLDHGSEGILPGERFDVDQQCMLKYGKDSVRSQGQNIADVCRDLHCQRDRYTWTSHPALEGTSCGTLMWCRSGVCVSKIRILSVQSNGNYVTAFKTIDKKTFLEGLKTASLKQDISRTLVSVPKWNVWGNSTECESGCLYGESGRLKEGSVGLRQYTRNCNDKRNACIGLNKKYETCIAKQCYNIVRTTILEFANQICARAKEFDSDILGPGIQKVAIDAEDACKVFCESTTGKPKTKGWIFPDGTACKIQNSDIDDLFYCISGRCQKFTCNSSTENFYRIDPFFCPESLSSTDKYSNSIQQENGRDYKSLKLKKYIWSSTQAPAKISQTNKHLYNSNLNKEISYEQWNTRHHDTLSQLRARANKWEVKSGCHFSCIGKAKGIQIVASKIDIRTNIQLCTPNAIACDKVSTTFEFATELCKRFQQKVQGLSGLGMQIASSIEDPDRSCRVACQDAFLQHRFYLVNGEQGHFPFGTRCNHNELNRYCVNGQCLRFGEDDTPVNESYNSLPHLRIKRHVRRKKRHFDFFSPINITERVSQKFLDTLIENIDFTNIKGDILEDSIDFTNPVHFIP